MPQSQRRKRRIESRWQSSAWLKAYREAAKELGMPVRDKLNSEANKRRKVLGPQVARRADEILQRAMEK